MTDNPTKIFSIAKRTPPDPNSNNSEMEDHHGRRTPPGKPSTSHIPRKWIESVIEIYENEKACWCNAIFLGVSWYIANLDQLHSIMDPVFLKKGYELAKEEVRQATWGNKENLKYDTKEPRWAPGVFVPNCSKQKDNECIFVNPDLLGNWGNFKVYGNPPTTLREITLPHESLHKLFWFLRVGEGPLKGINEEIVVAAIVRLY